MAFNQYINQVITWISFNLSPQFWDVFIMGKFTEICQDIDE